MEAEEVYSQVSVHVFGCVGAACDGAGYGGHVPAVHGRSRVSQHGHGKLCLVLLIDNSEKSLYFTVHMKNNNEQN